MKVLVLGACRSGKSSYALARAGEGRGRKCFIATLRTGDDPEMKERVARHKAARSPAWHTVEEPVDLAGAIAACASKADVVVVDCLTVWLANLLLRGDAESDIARRVGEVCGVVRDVTARLFLVSNEVGWGVVPTAKLGRVFRDAAGVMNRRVAAVADEVVLMVAGIPLFLKGGEGKGLDG